MAHLTMQGTTVTTIPALNDSGINGNPANGVASGALPLERRCDNPECTVYKMVTNVPKRKTPQFVTEPIVMEKPLLINGFTTIFQLEGQSAKLCDIKSSDIQKPIYRIVPNTHAHIVNYVVVDSDAESLRKINDNDPATMKKLLDSQKQSADQMLKKLIAGHTLPYASVSNNGNVATIATGTTPNIGNTTPVATTGVGSITPIAVSKLMPQTTTPAIQLPTRVHPNLKITAVASAEGLTTVSTGKNNALAVPTIPAMPMITPVPLANLQRAPVLPSSAINTAPQPSVMPSNVPMPSSLTSIGASTSTVNEVVEKPVFDKMQQELQELRRTVALLAEAQAKNKQN